MTMLSSRVFKPTAIVLALAVLSGPAIAKKKAEDDLVATGKSVDCIQPINIRSTHVRDDQTIDFIMNNGKTYRNVLPYSCPSLGFEQRFSYKLSTSQLCSVDIIHVLQNFGGTLSEGAGCGLGKFQEMEKIKK